MGDKRCCCGLPNCVVFEDDFGRPNASSPGDKYDVVLGDWSINDGRLIESGMLGAIIIATTRTATPEMGIWAKFENFRTSTGHQIIASSSAGAAEYFYADFEATGLRSSKITLGHSSAGILKVKTFAYEIDGEDVAYGGICIDEASFSAQLNWTAERWLWHCNPGLGLFGFYGGLGNALGNALAFDDFEVMNYLGSLEDPPAVEHPCQPAKCCRQQCMCCPEGEDREVCIPMDLTITLSAWGGCADLDGVTIPISWRVCHNIWGWWSNPNADQPSCLTNAQWVLRCTHEWNPGIRGFTLQVKNRDDGLPYHPPTGDTGCPFELYDFSVEEPEDCDPFEVAFYAYSYQFWELVDGELHYFGPETCPCCDPWDQEGGGFQPTVTE